MSESNRAEMLEQQANVARNRLMRTIDRLDRRRKRVVETTEETAMVAKRASIPIGVIAGVVAGASVMRAFMHYRNRKVQRFPLLLTLRPPPKREPSLVLRTLRNVAVTGITAIATALIRRYLVKPLESAPSSSIHVVDGGVVGRGEASHS